MDSNVPERKKKNRGKGGKYLKTNQKKQRYKETDVREQEAPQRKKHPVLAVVGKILSFVLATVLIIVIGLVGVIYVVEKGPSESARNLFVRSVRETSAAGFLAEFFLTEEEIAAIETPQSAELSAPVTDASLIKIEKREETITTEDGEEVVVPVEEIEILDVRGATFKGKMMVVHDPTRVYVGISKYLGYSGRTLEEMIGDYEAIGGVNGGGFEDDNGSGNGGIPIGVCIHEGELLYGAGKYADTAVIDYDGILHVGNMTGKEAMDLNARFAVSFGPILVVNGEKCEGLESGLNPRTAIGQRSDGAILLLVVDGRQLDSPGATYEDVANVMLEHGAVNAMNLDGGSSSMMIYEGEFLTNSASIVGQRGLPTCIIVK